MPATIAYMKQLARKYALPNYFCPMIYILVDIVPCKFDQ